MDLSIIIPVFNCEKYLNVGIEKLKPLLDSALQIEIIYIDDGSTDNSFKRLNEIKSIYSYDIKIISQQNSGAAVARNTGINLANGKYFLCLDADDYLNCDVIVECMELIQNNALDFASYRLQRVDDTGSILNIMTVFDVSGKIVSGIESLIQGYQPSSICVFIFRKDFLVENNLSFYPNITHEDVEFTFRFMLANPTGIFLEKVGYNYLLRNDSVTTPQTIKKLEKYLLDEVFVAKEMYKQLSHDKELEIRTVIIKNYNSVSWNLLWRLFVERKKFKKDYIISVINSLALGGLYPMKGSFKTKFQRLSSILINIRPLYLMAFKK